MASWTPVNHDDALPPASRSSSTSSSSGASTIPAAVPGATPAFAAALPPLPARPTGAMLALATLPPLRESTLREGRILKTHRPANMEALLGFQVGQVNGQPCTHCANGSGAWTECVSVPGHFNGACTNCHYGSEGSRCSFHVRNRSPAPDTQTVTPSDVTTAAIKTAAPSNRRRTLHPHAQAGSSSGNNNAAVVLPSRPPAQAAGRRPRPSSHTSRPSGGRVRRRLSSTRPSGPAHPAAPATTGRVRQRQVTRQERNRRIANVLGGFAEMLSNTAKLARELANIVEWEVVSAKEEENDDDDMPDLYSNLQI